MENSERDLEVRNFCCRLNHEWIQVLINLRMKYAKSFTGKRHSATVAWDSIVKEMYELGAPKTITRLKLKKKWMNLIARYKQLRTQGDTAKRNAWPYFDQINRAYTRNTIENMNDNNMSSNGESDQCEKEQFMKMLIEMRYKHRNLFTGKKYADQKGWKAIRNELPTGIKHTMSQIRNIWRNLMQKYKTIVESEPDHGKITWIYFDQLHKLMLEDNDNNNSNTIEFNDQESYVNVNNNIKALEDDKTVLLDDNYFQNKCNSDTAETVTCMEIGQHETLGPDNNKDLSQKSTSLNDLLNYLKEKDKKFDEQIKQLLSVTKEILQHLKQNY